MGEPATSAGFTPTRAPAFLTGERALAEVERQIEVVDPARHRGEEYPSVDIQRRYGRT